jgi:hypothetical protein
MDADATVPSAINNIRSMIFPPLSTVRCINALIRASMVKFFVRARELSFVLKRRRDHLAGVII